MKIVKMTGISMVCLLFGISVLAASPDEENHAISSVVIRDIRVESLINPMGLDERVPRFSWKLEDARRGAAQTAYQILAASTPALLSAEKGDLWDSGKVASDQSQLVAWAGVALKSRQSVYWKVKVWDHERAESSWSQSAYFEMGLLEKTDWQAQWIAPEGLAPSASGASWEYARFSLPKAASNDYAKAYADLIDRRMPSDYVLASSFELKSVPQNARMRSSAVGYYTVFINGQRIGDAEFEPAWVEPYSPAYAATYDVSGLLRVGRNEIRVQLSRGRNTPVSGDRSGRFLTHAIKNPPVDVLGTDKPYFPHLLLQIDGETKGGVREVLIATDTKWKAARGQRPMAYWWFGEICDGRIHPLREDLPEESEAWETVSTVCPTGWEIFNLNPRFRHFQPEREIYVVKPKRLISPGKGIKVYDLGEMISGTIRFRPEHVKSGQKLVFRYSQELRHQGLHDSGLDLWYPDTVQIENEGNLIARWGDQGIRFHNIAKRIPLQVVGKERSYVCPTDVYICSGKPGEVFNQAIRSHPFRYVEVIGLDQEPALDALEGRMIHSDIEPIASFTSSEPVFNEFARLARKTNLMNAHGMLSDCWDREKWPWGEARVRALQMIYDINIFPLLEKVSDDNAGLVMAHGFASSWTQIAANNPNVWHAASLAVLPWEIYQFTGDSKPLEKAYRALITHIRYIYPPNCTNWVVDTEYGDWLWFGSSLEGNAFWKQFRKDLADQWERAPTQYGLPASQRKITGTASMFLTVSIAEQAAILFGFKDDQKWLAELRESIKTQFNRVFFDSEEMTYGKHSDSGPWGTDVEDVTSLHEGLVLSEVSDHVFNGVVRQIQRRGHLPIGGVYTLPQLFDLMADYNKADDAYAVLTLEQPYGIKNMLKYSPDGMSELFYISPSIRGKVADWQAQGYKRPVKSSCHPTVGAIARYFQYGLAGIRPCSEHAGFKHFMLAPQIPKAMQYAAATYESPYGTIRSAWKHDGNEIVWEATVPPNTTATAFIPVTSGVMVDGKPLAESTLKNVLESGKGTTKIELSSGSYKFEFGGMILQEFNVSCDRVLAGEASKRIQLTGEIEDLTRFAGANNPFTWGSRTDVPYGSIEVKEGVLIAKIATHAAQLITPSRVWQLDMDKYRYLEIVFSREFGRGNGRLWFRRNGNSIVTPGQNVQFRISEANSGDKVRIILDLKALPGWEKDILTGLALDFHGDIGSLGNGTVDRLYSVRIATDVKLE
jgi:alpha-L-rhamnosidase